MVDVHLVEVGLGGVNLGGELEVGAGGGEAHELEKLDVGAVAQAGVRVVRGAHLDTLLLRLALTQLTHLYEGEADRLGPELVEQRVQGVDVGDVDHAVRDDHEATAAVRRQQLERQHTCRHEVRLRISHVKSQRSSVRLLDY